MSILRRLSFVCFLSASLASASSFTNPIFQNLSPKALNEVSREIQKAVNIRAFVQEYQVRSELSGKSEGHVRLKLQLETFHGFHVYRDRLETVVDSASHGQWDLKIIQSPDVVRFMDPVTHSLKEGYTGQDEFVFEARLNQALDQPPGAHDKIWLLTGLQMCNKEICLLPTVLRTEVTLLPKSPEAAPASFLERAGSYFKEKVANGGELSFLTFGILFLAGLITAFTPCVYPLYPITLGIFGRWSEQSHIPPLLLAIVYCASMTLSYAVLGLVSAASGTVFGSLTQTPSFLIGVGVLILLSSLFFSGLFQLQMPARLVNFLGSSRPTTGKKASQYYLQAALMGLSLGIVGSPCVGPVLVSLLAWLGTTLSSGGKEAYLKGFALLAIFGLGMSTPFLVLGHFVLRLHRRPQLGFLTPWVKRGGALIMAASAFFFIVPGVQLLRAKSAPVHVDFPVLSLETYRAASEKKWTVIDFRADWCAACVQLERETFSQMPIADLFRNGGWQMVKLDLTLSPPDLQAYAQEMGVVSLPSVLILNPEGKICRKHSLYEFENAENFRKRLEQVQKNCE